MSIASEITRINGNISAAYTACSSKGATMPQTQNSANLAGTINSIPSGNSIVEKKDVNFYDYDGTLLYSYTSSEAAELTELPASPAHQGLTFQSWNWSLQDIKAQLQIAPLCDIGATYIPTDGATTFRMLFPSDIRTEPALSFQLKNGTLTIDWGDGSTPDTVTESSTSYVDKTVTHQMAFASYPQTCCIKLTFSGEGNYKFNATVFGYTIYRVYVTDVSLGSHLEIGENALRTFYNLKTIIIPNGITSIGNNAFGECYALSSVVIPNGITSIGNTTFYYCYSLSSVSIPNSVTSMGSDAFSSCYALSSAVIPNSVTSFGSSYPFIQCYNLESVVHPISVSSFPTGFTYMYRLKSAIIPYGISVYYGSFTGCYSLSSVTLPNSVTSIRNSALANMTALTYFSIPRSVYEIRQNVFYNCTNLKYLDLSECNYFPSLDGSLGSNLPADFVILVATEAKKTELSAKTNWSNYASQIQVKGA